MVRCRSCWKRPGPPGRIAVRLPRFSTIGRILPIEVKCGKHYERHHALNHLVSDETCRIEDAIVFDSDAFKTKGVVSYLPIYMAMFLEPPELPDKMVYEV